MLHRSNAAGHWPDEVIHSCGQKIHGYPQDEPGSADAELLWLNGSESLTDRQTLLDELYAERFGLPHRER